MKRVAFYGSLRKGEYNYRAEQGEPIATGIIEGAQLFSLGAFPAIVKSEDPKDTVVVEVYDINDKLFDQIERMEIGAGYYRDKVDVHVTVAGPEHDIDDTIEADAYFHPQVQLHWGPRVVNGDWVSYEG